MFELVSAALLRVTAPGGMLTLVGLWRDGLLGDFRVGVRFSAGQRAIVRFAR